MRTLSPFAWSETKASVLLSGFRELSVGLIAAAMDNPLCPIQDDTEQKAREVLTTNYGYTTNGTLA